MSYNHWEECISAGADECGLSLTPDQLKCLAKSAEMGYENYGLAFYSPPSTDRISEIEREWKDKYDRLEGEFTRYRGNAEKAIGIALHQHPDMHLSIGEGGSVERYGGRIEVIQ